MTKKINPKTDLTRGMNRGLNRGLKLSTSVAALVLLGACSSVPDAINPVEWYRSTVDMITSDDTSGDEGSQTTQSAGIPGENNDFPDLNTVPARSQVLGSGDAGGGTGLIADPNKPEYASSISRQNDEVPPPVVQQTTQSDLQPAPPAQPVEPVVAATQLATPTAPAEPEISLQASTQFAQVAQSTQITQSTPTSTSTPLVIQGGVLPSGETYDEFRARLMSGLTQSSTQFSTVPSTANVQSNALVASSGSTSYSASDTVVISSSGIRSAVQYSTVQLADARSDGGYLQIATRNGQLMMSANSTRVATVHFSNGSSNLDANDRKVLRQVIALQKLNGGMIQIIGHASSRTRSMDPVRHKMVNYQVSVSRADAIANAMVRLGAQKENIMIGAVSDSRPLYFEVMPSGEAGNRRAEIYIDS